MKHSPNYELAPKGDDEDGVGIKESIKFQVCFAKKEGPGMRQNKTEYDTECVTECERLYSFSFRRGVGFDFFFGQILSS